MLYVFRFLLTALVAIGTLGPAYAISEKSSVKSFREWKISKVLAAESRLKELQAKSKDPNLTQKMGSEAGLNEELQNEIELELTHLSLSRDLTISDYFVGYLTKQSSLNAAVKDVAGRLSSEEVAELMLAYAEHFSRVSPPSVKLAPRAESGH